MFSIANIATVRDVAAIGQRNRDPVLPPAQDGAQGRKTADASSEAKAGNRDSNQLGPKRLTPDQERLVQELAQTDQKVRAHEAAHQAAAGSLGGAASFTYESGPDSKSYAVGGEVPVDMSSGRTPEGSSNEGSSTAGVPDVGAKATATVAALEFDRAATGPTSIQVQHIARLAASAYGM